MVMIEGDSELAREFQRTYEYVLRKTWGPHFLLKTTPDEWPWDSGDWGMFRLYDQIWCVADGVAARLVL